MCPWDGCIVLWGENPPQPAAAELYSWISTDHMGADFNNPSISDIYLMTDWLFNESQSVLTFTCPRQGDKLKYNEQVAWLFLHSWWLVLLMATHQKHKTTFCHLIIKTQNARFASGLRFPSDVACFIQKSIKMPPLDIQHDTSSEQCVCWVFP